MSIKTIKSDMEAYLKTNLTDIAIKWNNTNFYTLNGLPMVQADIDALSFFIEPSVIPISNERELISSNKPFSTEIFFQLDIYNKLNTGTGLVYTTIETLDGLFREKYINQTICDDTRTINSFIEGEFEITPHRIHCILWS